MQLSMYLLISASYCSFYESVNFMSLKNIVKRERFLTVVSGEKSFKIKNANNIDYCIPKTKLKLKK